MNDAAPIAAASAVPVYAPGPVPAVGGKVGVLLVNLGTPDGADAASVRRYLKEFLSDPRVIENQGLVWQLVLNGVILPSGRAARRATTPRSGTRTRTNPRSRPSPARRRKSSPPRSRRAGRASWSTGRCATAIPRSRRGSPIWWRAAATASSSSRSIRNTAPRPRRRWATRCFACSRRMRFQPALRIAPPYYDDAAYIEALAVHHQGGDRAARFQAGRHPRVVPRHTEGLCRQGRSLLHAMLETMRLLRARSASTRTKLAADVPVALRPRAMARARDRPDRQAARQGGREEHRGDHARLLGRLPGDAGGDRGRERAKSSSTTAARISPPSPASTTARRAWR